MAKISPKNIAQAIYEATEGKPVGEVAEVLKRTVAMLARKRVIGQAEEVVKALEDILDKKTNTVRARVISSQKLGTKEKNDIEEDIKQRYKAGKVVSEFFENGELLGGVRVEVGDEVLDNTYKNKLGQLEKHLIKGQ
jgi:F0F1-type ATP synthase delta subunit